MIVYFYSENMNQGIPHLKDSNEESHVAYLNHGDESATNSDDSIEPPPTLRRLTAKSRGKDCMEIDFHHIDGLKENARFWECHSSRVGTVVETHPTMMAFTNDDDSRSKGATFYKTMTCEYDEDFSISNNNLNLAGNLAYSPDSCATRRRILPSHAFPGHGGRGIGEETPSNEEPKTLFNVYSPMDSPTSDLSEILSDDEIREHAMNLNALEESFEMIFQSTQQEVPLSETAAVVPQSQVMLQDFVERPFFRSFDIASASLGTEFVWDIEQGMPPELEPLACEVKDLGQVTDSMSDSCFRACAGVEL